jgi:hypothetical protein
MRRLSILVVPISLSLLIGCQSNPTSTTSLSSIRIPSEGAAACRVSLDGSIFRPPGDDRALMIALRRERLSHSSSKIEIDRDVTYRCLGGTIIILQQAGFKRIGFISEPFPAKPH